MNPTGHDAVLLRRGEQLLAGALAGRLVLERHLLEAGEGVADVRLVVDREPPLPLRVDVGEGAVGQVSPLGRVELRHVGSQPREGRRTAHDVRNSGGERHRIASERMAAGRPPDQPAGLGPRGPTTRTSTSWCRPTATRTSPRATSPSTSSPSTASRIPHLEVRDGRQPVLGDRGQPSDDDQATRRSARRGARASAGTSPNASSPKTRCATRPAAPSTSASATRPQTASTSS